VRYYIAFLAQSAAFDLVDHQILIARLSAKFGICGPTLAWFQSYLSDRRQSVSVSGQFSSAVLLPSGVPQGSVLGPVLYILYTTPIHEISTSYGIYDHQYADDDQKYVSFRISRSSRERHLKQPFLCCIGTMKNLTHFWLIIDCY
jgi:hypothetical protein